MLLHQCMNHGLGIQVFEVSVGLTSANKDYWLTSDVRH